MEVRPHPSPSDLLADRFELQRVLGTGGMATVWSALDTRLGRTVAVKILKPDLTADHADRIAREARAAARIDDHRVVTVLDLEHTDAGDPFLVFEALSGATLADELRTSGALETPRALRLASDLLGGLGSAHACGVLHRDVKPSNILVHEDGFRITDFGIASLDDDTGTGGDLMGTLVYLAPERFDGAPSSPQADVFSAGAVLYEALTGHQPFRTASSSESFARLRSGTYAPLPDHVPTRLRGAIAAALDPDPSHRPADASAFERLVDPDAEDPTQQLPVDDPTTRLHVPSRVDQPTEQSLPPVDEPAGDSGADEATVLVAPRADAAPPDGVAPASGPGWPAWFAMHLRRPPVIFSTVAIVLLVLTLVVAGSSDSDSEQEPRGDPMAVLDQNLERIEEIGR